MNPRTRSAEQRDSDNSNQMGEIREKLATAEREREETRKILRAVEGLMTELQIAMAKLVTIQEETQRRLSNIDAAIGNEHSGLTTRMTKLEGLHMLDEAEVADLDKRVTALENKASAANRWAMTSLAGAVGSLLLVIGRILHLIP